MISYKLKKCITLLATNKTELTDLGVITNRPLKSSTQAAAAAKNANKTFGIIGKDIANKTEGHFATT